MSKQYNLIILPEAQKDIRDIVIYIARELAAPQAALNLQAEFEKAINTLAERPKRIKIDILPRLKPWDSNSRKKALLIPAKSITFGRFRSAAYATAMALGI